MLDAVEAVCRIAVDWRDDETLQSLIATRYAPVRAEVEEQRVAKVLSRHPDLVTSWVNYASDTRTSNGWALARDSGWTIWRPFPEDGDERRRPFGTELDACAAYVVAELEYWHTRPGPTGPS